MHTLRQSVNTPRTKCRALMTALAVAGLAYCGAAQVLRALPLTNIVFLAVAVSSVYLPLLALVSVVLATASRRLLLSTSAALMLVASLMVQVPWYYIGHAQTVGAHVDVRVLASNLRKGQADPSSFVSLAVGSADVLAVSELTPELVHRFAKAGLDAAFPYSVLLPRADAVGRGLWSRYPIADVVPVRHRRGAIIAVRLDVPGVRFDPLVAPVHTTSPLADYGRSFDEWRRNMVATGADLTDFADAAGPAAVIVAGDYNSTPDMRQFRDLLTGGYRDAVQQSGAGFGPTFPSRSGRPPLITIDHIVTRHAVARSVRTVYVPGSDHRAVLASIEIPLDPTAS